MMHLSGAPFFQKVSEIPPDIFDKLWDTVSERMKSEPDDSAGLSGPSVGDRTQKARFLTWVIDYLDDGIAEKYWGPESQGKWRLEEDRDQIVDFFRSVIMYRAKKERGDRAKKYKHKVVRRASDVDKSFEKHKEGNSDVEPDEKDSEVLSLEGNCPGDDDDSELHQPSSAINTPSTQASLSRSPGIAEAGPLVKYEPRKRVHIRDSGTFGEATPLTASYQRNLQKASKKGSVLAKRQRSLPLKAKELVGDVVPTPSVTPSLLPSIRQYELEETPSPPQKRPRQIENIPQDVAIKHSEVGNCNSVSPSTKDQDLDRVFKTRLEDDNTIAFLFAPSTISFQGFYVRFCKVWKKEIGEMGVGDVDAKVSIPGVGEYQLSFGEDRKRSWAHIMKLAEGRPESDILVTMSGFSCDYGSHV